MTTATTSPPLTVVLPPTATYTRRRATWIAGRGAHADQRDGTLRVVLDRNKGRSGDTTEVDEYGVQETTGETVVGVREFLLRSDTDEAQPDVYAVTVAGPRAGCTCRAGSVGRHECKHVSSVLALLAGGAL